MLGTHFSPKPTLGIIGFGAFGRLMADHLSPHFDVRVHDRRLNPGSWAGIGNVPVVTLSKAAECQVVVLATPLSEFADVLQKIRDHLVEGAMVLDVCSVKVTPSGLMSANLPEHVSIVATHPLFGPQSAIDGVVGLKIAICPIRGRVATRVAAFLRSRLGLKIIMTTPQEHDHDMAVVQGLTHLIAKVLVQMEPVPTRMTTRSFDLLVQATNMVRHDAPEVFEAICNANPYIQAVRSRLATFAVS